MKGGDYMEYKCKMCGSESNEPKECCGQEMEKKCQTCGKVVSECGCG
jgi:DNA-directed RNA polymerase subunit RPC12/RpoP